MFEWYGSSPTLVFLSKEIHSFWQTQHIYLPCLDSTLQWLARAFEFHHSVLNTFHSPNQEEKVKIYQWPLGVGLENLHFKHGDAHEIVIDFVSTQTSSQSSDIKIQLFK